MSRPAALRPEGRAAIGMSYRLFAFRHGDTDGDHDLTRHGLPDWRLDEAVRWAFTRGADTVLLEKTDGALSSSRLVTHHVCNDAWCPGGCE